MSNYRACYNIRVVLCQISNDRAILHEQVETLTGDEGREAVAYLHDFDHAADNLMTIARQVCNRHEKKRPVTLLDSIGD